MNATSATPIRALKLKDFDFGYASAATEATDSPELLDRGFLDHMGIIDRALHGREFLFLGYKGSGKSAIGEHLVLLKDPTLFVRLLAISDLDFRSFSQISKQTEPDARYPNSWAWLLILQLFDSFVGDLGSNCEKDAEMYRELACLRDAGLIPCSDLRLSVAKTLDSGLSLKFPWLEVSKKTGQREVADIPFFVEHLKNVLRSVQSPNKHIIVIDGFDDLLRRNTLQFDALGALIFETNRMNTFLAKHHVPAKILLLCRTDLFERLPGPNNNKIRQDYGINITWSHQGGPEHSPLVKLINLRASLRHGAPLDVFSEYLPTTMPLRGASEVPTIRALLNLTRYVPRDMVVLFRKLQHYSGEGRMSPSQVFNASVAFSKEYFVQEIRDELDGEVDPNHIALTFRLFASIGRRRLRMRDLEQWVKKLAYPQEFELEKAMGALFECSAVGNAEANSPAVYRFNNTFAMFNSHKEIIFHPALWDGLNLK